MDPVTVGVITIGFAFVLLILRVPIAFALGASATVGLIVVYGWTPGSEFNWQNGIIPTLAQLGNAPYSFINSSTLATIPLFVFMGHLAYEAGFTTDIYRAARLFLARVPGGLAMASVVGCGGFSAITGSSVACAAAMGRIAIPEMLKYKYSPALATGAVASGGTLGSLIPPSVLFILYGIFTEQSIEALFIAGIIPGLLSLLGYIVVILIWSRVRPSAAPMPQEDISRRDLMMSVFGCWGIVLIFVVVIGGIYFNVFTPSESAGVGAVATLILGLALGRLKWGGIRGALKESTFQTAMIFAIAIGGKVFVTFMAASGVTEATTAFIKESELALPLVLLAIVILYIALGMFMDPIGIILLTLPVTVPIVQSYGLSLIWFGVVVVKLLEIGLITPPVGLNVFVIKSVTGAAIRLETIFKGILLFLAADFLVLAALVAIPWLSLVLPGLMR